MLAVDLKRGLGQRIVSVLCAREVSLTAEQGAIFTAVLSVAIFEDVYIPSVRGCVWDE